MFDVGVIEEVFLWQLTWKQQPAHLKEELWKECRPKFPHASSERMVDTQVSGG